MTKPTAPPKHQAALLVEDAGRVAMQRAADGAILHFAERKNNPSLGPKLINRTVDPLDWYLHRKQITGDQHNAGDWMRRLHYVAYGSGYATVNLGGIHGVADSSQNWRFTGRSASALRTICDYLQALPTDERFVLERVVHWSQFANVAARQLGLSERRGIVLLRSALSAIDAWRNEGLPERRGAG